MLLVDGLWVACVLLVGACGLLVGFVWAACGLLVGCLRVARELLVTLAGCLRVAGGCVRVACVLLVGACGLLVGCLCGRLLVACALLV